MTLRLKDLTLFEQLVLALSLVLIGFLLIDPFMLERSKALQPEARKVFRAITDIGRSNWMLIPTGAALALALVLQKRDVGFRNAPAYGLIASAMGFVFVSVGGAGLIATLTKNILGRARPKLFDTMGPFEFKLFAFSPNYASLPSGHATNMFALATVIAILWPRAKVLAGSCSESITSQTWFLVRSWAPRFPITCGTDSPRAAGCSSGPLRAATASGVPGLSAGSGGRRQNRHFARRGFSATAAEIRKRWAVSDFWHSPCASYKRHRLAA
jgi:membrane-associated phospholipid phosphatase